MSDIIQIPLNRLTLWNGNVRKTDLNTGIGELAQSIAAHGLLQSLVVRKGKRGKYDIVAGQRRFLALRSLAERGVIDADFVVPCIVANADVDATELSLAENVMRAPMHPADQFEAYRTLIDDGASIADVAARFGAAESTVAKRLKLGRLSPVVLDAFRDGAIDLDQAQAFTVSDDHEEQERILAELPDWNRGPDRIRASLTEHEVRSSDKRVRFIGIDAYREAGGTIRQDLFDEDGAGYLTDVALLDRLVAEKLEVTAQAVSAEGWSWVEIAPDAGYGEFASFKRVQPVRAPLSEADQAELDDLSQTYDALVESDEYEEDRLAELEQRMAAINDRYDTWSGEKLARAGVIIALEFDGELRIERGLVRKSDVRKPAVTNDDDETTGAANKQSAGLPARLIEDLTSHRSAAIAAELMNQPDIALASVVHALAIDAFRIGYDQSCLKLSFSRSQISNAVASSGECKGLIALEQECESMADRLPGNPHELFHWLLSRTRDELLEVLALIAAMSVDAVQRKDDRPGSARLAYGDALARALQLEIGNWFTPTANNYFAHVTRAQILSDLDEANGSHAPALDKLKKSDLAARAEALVANTGWLPEPVRIAVNDNVDGDQSESAE